MLTKPKYLSKIEPINACLRPTTMDLLKTTLNILNHCKTMLKMSGKMRWMKEVMKPFNKFKYVPAGHMSRFHWPKQARVSHAPTGRVSDRERGERKRSG